ncbi:uncharacterized protein [Diabrotica undecimpunctata]|uniref:uncharacterized protein n=1 Tax=Diabrotica undecimpunctata TaxID=50387 RepID=UPI003B63C4F7
MEFKVLWILPVFFFQYRCSALSINDKLDFGGRSSNHASLADNHGVHINTFTPVTRSSTSIKVDNKDVLDKKAAACTPEGCNVTKSMNDPNDTIKTDVVIHIESNLDLKPKNDEAMSVDNVPDVPIITGTDSSNSNNAFSTDQKTIFIPGNQPSYPSNVYRNMYGPSYSSSTSPNFFDPNRRYDFTNNDQGRNYWNSPTIMQMSDPNRNAVVPRYNNGIELTIPRFDPTLHNHYFGERPPPQSAIYSRRTSIMNPVEFKIMKPVWQPSSWQHLMNNYRYNAMPHAMSKGIQCACGHNTGSLQLQSNLNRQLNLPHPGGRNPINDPGTQINDKLGSFN